MGGTLQEADSFLVGLRWAVLCAGTALSAFKGAAAARDVWLPFPLLAALAVAVNFALSLYGVRARPFGSGRSLLPLLADMAQAVAMTVVAGGPFCVFSPLFYLLVVELAIALSLRSAAACILGVCILYVTAAASNQAGQWTMDGACMACATLFIILIVGTLALAFMEQLRRTDHSRAGSEEYAERLSQVNDLFLYGERLSGDITQALGAFWEGARRLLKAERGVLVLGEPVAGCWAWEEAAAAVPREEVRFSDWGWRIEKKELYIAGAAYRLPLPSLWAGEDMRVVAGVRLSAPEGCRHGAFVIARSRGVMEDADWLLLRALGREAEMAVRTARLSAAERAQVEQLRRFEHARQSFLSAISRELRAPLTALKTLLPSLAGDEPLSGALRTEVKGMVAQNIGRLESVAGDFLESLRLETGMLTLACRPLDVSLHARRAVELLQPLFDAQRRRVTVETPAAPVVIRADGGRVDQILSGLLHNALTFTPPAGRIRVVVTEAEGGGAGVCVEDDGPEVPPEARERVFEKSYSASAGPSPTGSGLGLSICRELVSLHGGRIWCEGRPGGGNRFCFTLPEDPHDHPAMHAGKDCVVMGPPGAAR